MVEKLVHPVEGASASRGRALKEQCRGMFLGQVLGEVGRVTGPFSTIKGALAVVSRQVQDLSLIHI